METFNSFATYIVVQSWFFPLWLFWYSKFQSTFFCFAIWELKASRRWTDERQCAQFSNVVRESHTTRNRDDLLRECATVREWDPVGSVCNCRWSSSDVIFFSSHFNSPVSDNNFSVFYYNISFIFFLSPFYFLCLRKGRRFIKIFYTIREEGWLVYIWTSF